MLCYIRPHSENKNDNFFVSLALCELYKTKKKTARNKDVAVDFSLSVVSLTL